jgi:hypothetical protein
MLITTGLKMGLFDGLTKGMESLIGAEEASGPNIAPKVDRCMLRKAAHHS